MSVPCGTCAACPIRAFTHDNWFDISCLRDHFLSGLEAWPEKDDANLFGVVGSLGHTRSLGKMQTVLVLLAPHGHTRSRENANCLVLLAAPGHTYTREKCKLFGVVGHSGHTRSKCKLFGVDGSSGHTRSTDTNCLVLLATLATHDRENANCLVLLATLATHPLEKSANAGP